MRHLRYLSCGARGAIAIAVIALASCTDRGTTAPIGDGLDQACALTEHTAPSSTVTAGCARLDRDTSSCDVDRAALGLAGFWRRMSCRVTLSTPDPAHV